MKEAEMIITPPDGSTIIRDYLVLYTGSLITLVTVFVIYLVFSGLWDLFSKFGWRVSVRAFFQPRGLVYLFLIGSIGFIVAQTLTFDPVQSLLIRLYPNTNTTGAWAGIQDTIGGWISGLIRLPASQP
ncbi:MAG: hypothetical protein QXT16_04320 [Candidatus Caldarchaeum sp.]